MNLKKITTHVLILAFICGLAANAFSADIPKPDTFFGHKPGADFKLIRWEKIYEYFQLLAAESNKIQVEELGQTTLGNPFILAIISSPENISKLEKYKEIAKKLAKGRISEEEASRLAKEGKTIALITCSMHASEIGPTQMSPELGYVLATSNSQEIEEVLENVILLLVPSWNPDGNIMVLKITITRLSPRLLKFFGEFASGLTFDIPYDGFRRDGLSGTHDSLLAWLYYTQTIA